MVDVSKLTHAEILTICGELDKYAELAGDEAGAAYMALSELAKQHTYFADSFINPILQEVLDTIEWYHGNTEIVTRFDTITRTWEELEYL